MLAGWEKNRLFAVRALLRALLTPLKHAHFDRPSMFAHVGCRYELPAVRDEQPRWLSQVTDGREAQEDVALECEVVVIGTGAGGAAAAYELASRGRAVLLLEEGDYHRRGSFRGVASWANETMYRDQGMTIALGNVGIPVFSGRAVGGSTVINSGTCYRTPPHTFKRWGERFGLGADFTPEGLAPYYERVEAMLQVGTASPLTSAPSARSSPARPTASATRTARSRATRRTATGRASAASAAPRAPSDPPTSAMSPRRCKRGAQLWTAAHVDTINMVAGRARGVTASLGPRREGRRRPKLTVKADAVIVAGGTLMTPLLLQRSGLGKSPSLGKNLSIHPASKVFALFDDRVEQWRGIPQGYSVDQFQDEGLMFEGGSVPFHIAALGVPWTGRRFMDLMAQYPHLATFGFMIQDESRGEVRAGPGGSPLVIYRLNDRDVRLMQRGFETLCEIFQAAGARRVLPLLAGHDEATTPEALARLRASRIRAGDMEITAYHPLGTCRVGADEGACLDPDHQLRGARGVYVCDGSAVPSSLGVNPQMTIMAMALRAAEIVDGSPVLRRALRIICLQAAIL